MVTNEQYEKALNSIDNRKIMDSACLSYSNIPPDELERCKLIALWDALRKFNSSKGMKFTSYLYHQTKFQCLKYINSNKKYNQRFKYSAMLDIVDVTQNPKIHNLFLSLNEKDKDLIIQRFWYNKSLKEIGEENGYSHEIARRRINELLENLKETYEDL